MGRQWGGGHTRGRKLGRGCGCGGELEGEGDEADKMRPCVYMA